MGIDYMRTAFSSNVLDEEVEKANGFRVGRYYANYEKFLPLFDRSVIRDNVRFFNERMTPTFVLTDYKLSGDNKRLFISFRSDKTFVYRDDYNTKDVEYNSLTFMYDISECDEVRKDEDGHTYRNMATCIQYIHMSDLPFAKVNIEICPKENMDENFGGILDKEIRHFKSLNIQEPEIINADCCSVLDLLTSYSALNHRCNYIEFTEKEISELSDIFQLRYVESDRGYVDKNKFEAYFTNHDPNYAKEKTKGSGQDGRR